MPENGKELRFKKLCLIIYGNIILSNMLIYPYEHYRHYCPAYIPGDGVGASLVIVKARNETNLIGHR
jgi:hypothetical protein